MTRIKDHNAFVRQHEESRIIMVIRLEIGTDEHFIRLIRSMIDLRRLNITLRIDVTDIGTMNRSRFICVSERSRVGKPAPSAGFGYGADGYFMQRT